MRHHGLGQVLWEVVSMVVFDFRSHENLVVASLLHSFNRMREDSRSHRLVEVKIMRLLPMGG